MTGRYLVHVFLIFVCLNGFSQTKSDITIHGTRFYMGDEPFQYTGISFFNAIYNPEFNKTSNARLSWIKKFKKYGINVLRVWAQWDNKSGFVDTCPDCTLYKQSGEINMPHLKTLKSIIEDAAKQDVVILLALFQRESWNDDIRLSDEASNRAVNSISRELLPYRNLIFQIWNEFDYRTVDYFNIIKNTDPERLVTNSPGYAGILGSPEENRTLDFLSPHTTRNTDSHWRIAPEEIGYLLAKYNKPVVDDEPARKGTRKFGGPTGATDPFDHIIHMVRVLEKGGYVIYHHDMFQTGYNTEAVPPTGIPDPEFLSYHQKVFDFLRIKDRYNREFFRK